MNEIMEEALHFLVLYCEVLSGINISSLSVKQMDWFYLSLLCTSVHPMPVNEDGYNLIDL